MLINAMEKTGDRNWRQLELTALSRSFSMSGNYRKMWDRGFSKNGRSNSMFEYLGERSSKEGNINDRIEERVVQVM